MITEWWWEVVGGGGLEPCPFSRVAILLYLLVFSLIEIEIQSNTVGARGWSKVLSLMSE